MLLVAACLLFGAIGAKLTDRAGMELPEWTGVGKTQSALEGRAYQKKPELALSTLADGTFQSTTEKYLSDLVPARDSVLLANAAVQRSAIAAANVPFAFPVYPSFFGSNYIVDPVHRAIYNVARTMNPTLEQGAHVICDSIARSAEKHPEVQFVFNLVVDTYVSEHNPSYAYVSGGCTEEWLEEHVFERLGTSVEIVCDSIESEEELYRDWFLTDHHWREAKFAQSYNNMASLLGWPSFKEADAVISVPEWYGASAREGLCLDYPDTFESAIGPFGNLTCSLDGKEVERGQMTAVAQGKGLNDPLNVYGAYYGNPNNVAYKNSDNSAEGTCLFVEQSYGVPLEQLVANNYETTICVAPLNTTVNTSLEELIAQHEPSTVVVQFGVYGLRIGSTRSPNFF